MSLLPESRTELVDILINSLRYLAAGNFTCKYILNGQRLSGSLIHTKVKTPGQMREIHPRTREKKKKTDDILYHNFSPAPTQKEINAV